MVTALQVLREGQLSRGSRIRPAKYNPQYNELEGSKWEIISLHRYRGKFREVIAQKLDGRQDDPDYLIALTDRKMKKHEENGRYLGYFRMVTSASPAS